MYELNLVFSRFRAHLHRHLFEPSTSFRFPLCFTDPEIDEDNTLQAKTQFTELKEMSLEAERETEKILACAFPKRLSLEFANA